MQKLAEMLQTSTSNNFQLGRPLLLAARSKSSIDISLRLKASKKEARTIDKSEELARKKVDWKKYKKTCSADGCTNQVIKGGVCIEHGAKRKLCSSDGCTNQAKRGGVCIKHGAKVKPKLCSAEGCTNQSRRGGVCKRHGAYHNPHEESTAFTSCFGSEFDKTTATRLNQRTAAPSGSQDSVPEEVAVCVVIANDLVEV